jgi:hypothetical protein
LSPSGSEFGGFTPLGLKLDYDSDNRLTTLTYYKDPYLTQQAGSAASSVCWSSRRSPCL